MTIYQPQCRVKGKWGIPQPASKPTRALKSQESYVLVNDIVLLEKVQRRVSRLALGRKRGKFTMGTSHHFKMVIIRKPKIVYSFLIERYKCVISLNKLDFQDFFQFALKRMRSKLQFKASNCNCYKHLFLLEF